MPDFTATGAADYTRLRDLLKAGQWNWADRETRQIVLQIATSLRKLDALSEQDAKWIVSLDYLTEDDCTQFPCEDLCAIDNLWTKYSEGQFGFGIQAQIWQELKGDYALFAEAVGWSMGDLNSWRTYSELIFDLNAPEGHLPAGLFYTEKGLAVGWCAPLSLRLDECQKLLF